MRVFLTASLGLPDGATHGLFKQVVGREFGASLAEGGIGGLRVFFAVGTQGEDFWESFRTLGKGGMAEGGGDEAGLGLILGGGGFDVDVEFLFAALADEKGSDDGFAIEE